MEPNIPDRDTWIARLSRDDDKDGILRLSAYHYGEKEQVREGYFDWLYGNSPAGRPIVAVAEDLTSGEIVGFTWHLPLHVSLQGLDSICLMGCNALVHPSHRRKGIYVTLREITFDQIENEALTYGFPKPSAIYPHGKAGVLPVARIPLLVLPLDMNALSRTRLSNAWVRTGVEIGWRVASNTILKPRRSSPEIHEIRISEQNRFDEGFDCFWENVANKYPIMIKRDRAFLNWRFYGPSFRSYHVLSAKAGNQIVGYVVLRCADIGGVKTGLIMDLLVEDGIRGEAAGLCLLEETRFWFSANKMALAGCLMLPHTQEYKVLRRAGFVECPQRFAPQSFTLAAKCFSPQLTTKFLLNPKNWFITSANHDAV